MSFVASIDTSIYGRAYHQGEEVDTSSWDRNQFLQMLDLGLINGATGTVVVNGPEVMASQFIPSLPRLVGAPHAYEVTWDGLNEDGSTDKPVDWAWTEIHSSITPNFTFNPSTLRGTITAPAGGSQVCVAGLEYELGINDTYEVILVYRNTAGVASLPSQRGSIRVGQIETFDIADFSLTARKFQSTQHLLY